jgi:hypothetical protein
MSVEEKKRWTLVRVCHSVLITQQQNCITVFSNFIFVPSVIYSLQYNFILVPSVIYSLQYNFIFVPSVIYPAISTFAVEICYTNKFVLYSY